MTADGHGVSSWGDEKVLELVMMVEHLGEFSWPSISAGSASMVSTNRRSEYSRKNIPESSKKRNLNLLHWHYLHSIYIVVVTIYIAFTVY